MEGSALEQADGEWSVGTAFRHGDWNTVSLSGGEASGARLVASSNLHIRSLEAAPTSDRSLSIRVKLSDEGIVTLYFSLTGADGHEAGRLEVVVGRRTRDLTVEMPVTESLSGSYRLKATLIVGDRVLDNARLEIAAN